MSGDSSVGGLSFHDSIFVNAYGGHETKGSEALSNDVGLNISVIVLASPNDTATTLNDLGDKIVNKTVLVEKSGSIELFLELSVEYILEGVYEESIILLQDGVL